MIDNDKKKYIKIRGAKENNLNNISLEIPRISLLSLQGLVVLVNHLWLLTQYMLKGRDDIWSLFLHMLDNS